MQRRSIRNWTIRGTYLYLVCLVMLIMAVMGAGKLVTGAVDFINPPPEGVVFAPKYPLPADAPPPPLELVKAQREVDAARAESTGPPFASGMCISGAAMIVFALPAYFLHWRRVRREEPGGMWPRVEWGVKNVYFYAVCFIALMFIASSAIGVMTSAAKVAWEPPSTAYSPGPVEIYQGYVSSGEQPPDVASILAEAEAGRRREEAQQAYYKMRGLLQYAAMLIVALPVFLYHWRRVLVQFAAAAREAAEVPEAAEAAGGDA